MGNGMMKTVCPHCQRELELEKDMAGKIILCPHCNRSFTAAQVKFCVDCGQLNSRQNKFCSECGKKLKPHPVPARCPIPQAEPPLSIRTIITHLLFLGGLCGSALLFTVLTNYAGDHHSFLKIFALIGVLASISMLSYAAMVFCNAVGDSKNLPRMIRNTIIFFTGFYLLGGVIFLGAWLSGRGPSQSSASSPQISTRPSRNYTDETPATRSYSSPSNDYSQKDFDDAVDFVRKVKGKNWTKV